MKLITGNKGKLKEFQTLLDIEGIKVDLIEIQSTNVKEVVKHKIEEAKKYVDGEFLVEDTGLYLGSDLEIGALIKWIPNDRIVKAYKGESALAVCCIGKSDGTTYTGEILGGIVEPRGKNGFGWDCIFEVIGTNKTLAEMTEEEKNHISHRREAIKKLNK